MADVWNGEPLADANVVKDDIHYRVHDADTGELLGFGTARGGSLAALAAHSRLIEGAHPGRHLVIRQYDQAAGPQHPRSAGPQPG